ncbi:MAG: hypothetical protein AAF572_12740 [Cyanobacteria bacterium P01_B01_bin.77]
MLVSVRSLGESPCTYKPAVYCFGQQINQSLKEEFKMAIVLGSVIVGWIAAVLIGSQAYALED